MPIAIHSLHNEVGHKRIIFPGGEVHVTVDNITIGTERIQIHADLFSSDDIMELMMVTNAIKVQWPGYQIELVMPYIPYARQDRVGLQGEALSIKVFADFINSQNYVSVEVWDAHSDVALALIDRVTNVGQYELTRIIRSSYLRMRGLTRRSSK
jgi:ribose-phosphate pyrophosphokinase